jgi:hypothetical protein
MTETILHLSEAMFSNKERMLIEHGSLHASVFRFDSGVCAVRLANGLGEMILLPFQGQQIWSATFGGRNLTMRSMFDQPRATRTYLETYGGFLLHCGATAMGVPGPSDNHPLHGDLPNAQYQKAYLTLGENNQGAYIALGGSYQHTVAFNFNYTAEPLVTLHENATTFKVEMTIINLKNTPMPLMYLAHVNFRPVDNGRLIYTAICNSQHVRVRTSIPSHIHPLPGYKEFLADLQAQPKKHHILAPGLGYDPEVVFYIDYLADARGWAHTMQVHPDGSSDYLCHKPDQLRKGVRWISRTPDQDALGLVLPATAEPEGYHAEESKGNILELGPQGCFYLEMEMGYLAPGQAAGMMRRIEDIISKQVV